MLLLVSGATRDVPQAPPEYVGILIEPQGGNKSKYVRREGRQWALDNGCFNGLDKDAFVRTLQQFAGIPGCLFAVAPDVLGDAPATLLRFRLWHKVLKYYGYPVALVGQDGLEDLPIPWSQFDAFFIGGSTEWKLSARTADLVREAKQHGKWVHMGRVNSVRRIRYAQVIGCDSVDGTGFSIEPGKIGRILPTLQTRQLPLFADAEL